MSAPGTSFWQRLDKAAFGIIYGAIMVLGIMMAAGDHPEAPGKTAAVLFGSVLAITLAKAFAEFVSAALERGERLGPGGWRDAWHHAYPTLAVANLPTLLFLGAAAGWLTVEMAVVLSQALCIGLLMLLGGRVGWAATDGGAFHAILGALFAGGIGIALAIMKVVIH